MEKLPMCRICLVEDVHLFVVINRNLHELYEKLTDIPFITEDRRPMLACFFCCAKLKQCHRFLRQCLEAEELFAQMMNEDYEPNPIITQDHIEFCTGFIISPTENISIDDECQTESIAVKEELPAVCVGLNDIIEPEEEHQTDELEPENLDSSCLDVADIPPHHSESDVEDDMPLMEFKTEVEKELSKKKQTARETKRAAVAKKRKLETRRTKLEDVITAQQTRKDKSDSKVIRTTQKRTSKPGTYFKEHLKSDQRSFNRVKVMIQPTEIGKKPYNCDVCQRSFSQKSNLTTHNRIHTGEKPYQCDVCQRSFSIKRNLTTHNFIHTGEKPYQCDVCQRSFSMKRNLIMHIRVHTGEKPYQCDVCQRNFSVKRNLTMHIRVHTGDKPYKCDLCQQNFTAKGRLNKHIRVHTGDKPYKCDVCQQNFTTKDSLNKHIRIHIGDKPYKCNVCQRSFRRNYHLTRHIRIHTGKKV